MTELNIEAIFSLIFQRLPHILLYSGGIIYALMVWRHAPKPSQYVIIGLGLLLFQSIGSGFYYSMFAVQIRGTSTAELVSWGFRLLFIVGMVMILIAVFIDRRAKR